jgi:hypothetical protein
MSSFLGEDPGNTGYTIDTFGWYGLLRGMKEKSSPSGDDFSRFAIGIPTVRLVTLSRL